MKHLVAGFFLAFILIILLPLNINAAPLTKDFVTKVDLKYGVRGQFCKVDIGTKPIELLEPTVQIEQYVSLLEEVFTSFSDTECTESPFEAIIGELEYEFRNIDRSFDEFVIIYNDEIYRFDSPALLGNVAGEASASASDEELVDYVFYKSLYRQGADVKVGGEEVENSGIIFSKDRRDTKNFGIIFVFEGEAYKLRLPEEIIEKKVKLLEYENPKEPAQGITPENIKSAVNNFPIFEGVNGTFYTQTESTRDCRDDSERRYGYDCESKIYVWETINNYKEVWNWYKDSTKNAGWSCDFRGFKDYGPRNSDFMGCKKNQLRYRLDLKSRGALVTIKVNVPNSTNQEVTADTAEKSIKLADEIKIFPGAVFKGKEEHKPCLEKDETDYYCGRITKKWETDADLNSIIKFYKNYDFPEALECRDPLENPGIYTVPCYPPGLVSFTLDLVDLNKIGSERADIRKIIQSYRIESSF